MSDSLRPKANKNLGQHYLNSKETIDKICQDFANNAKGIIEIGPGPGTLTQSLAEINLPFYLVEKDSRFLEMLQEIKPVPTIINADALKLDFEQQILSKVAKCHSWWLVSNLPYNVGVPIMLKTMKLSKIQYMTLMFQKEVAQKIELNLFPPKKRNKEMNSLHSLCQNYFEVSLLKKVPAGQFSPPPKVDSAVLSFERRTAPVIPLEQWSPYENFLRLLFGHRRKQIGSILKKKFTVENLELAYGSVQISPTDRSETLSLSQVQQLFIKLNGKND